MPISPFEFSEEVSPEAAVVATLEALIGAAVAAPVEAAGDVATQGRRRLALLARDLALEALNKVDVLL